MAEIGCRGARQKASTSDSNGFTRSCGRLKLVQLVRRRLLCRGAVSLIWSALARGSFGRTAVCAPPSHRFPTHEATHRRIPVTYIWNHASVTYGRNGCGLNSGDAATFGAKQWRHRHLLSSEVDSLLAHYMEELSIHKDDRELPTASHAA